MTLIQSWKDSLQLLKPKNFKLFVLVTIKSITDAYKLYFKYFWWLLLSILVLWFIAPDYITAYNNYDVHSLAYYATLIGVTNALYGLLFLAVCFITRPSILQKNCAYLCLQYIKIIPYWFIWGLIIALLLIQSSAWQFLAGLSFVSSRSPEFIFFVLFFADSEGRVKNFFTSLWNSFKMIIYNFPLLVMIIFCFSLPVVLVNRLFFISPLMRMIIGAFLMPIGVCTFANIYIKRLHDQFDLYFKQPE